MIWLVDWCRICNYHVAWTDSVWEMVPKDLMLCVECSHHCVVTHSVHTEYINGDSIGPHISQEMKYIPPPPPNIINVSQVTSFAQDNNKLDIFLLLKNIYFWGTILLSRKMLTYLLHISSTFLRILSHWQHFDTHIQVGTASLLSSVMVHKTAPKMFLSTHYCSSLTKASGGICPFSLAMVKACAALL